MYPGSGDGHDLNIPNQGIDVSSTWDGEELCALCRSGRRAIVNRYGGWVVSGEPVP